MNHIAKLYMRQRCHLCEDAKRILKEIQQTFDFSIVEVDIDKDERLIELYGISIPVIELEGEEIQSGIINKNFVCKAFSEKKIPFSS
ncbi:glutaredoxin family protein [Bacillus sp. B15-48]|uniref:glutaredoxin family protein n=1 Tax=Bacillus sp. B15-48 TaxID=1548601 RepID=UPI00193FF798|nr:glutaredoxin family protein [Bacillus sp. B15-48]MBM4760808.1 glutaredoxin family protein [Bacillus sp. B15-48]